MGCSIEVHGSRWEDLDPVKEVFILKFEPAIKGKVIMQQAACLCKEAVKRGICCKHYSLIMC